MGFDGLLSYEEARDFFLDDSNKVYIDLVRKVWDSRSSNRFPQCRQVKDAVVLVYIGQKTGNYFPFGNFRDYAEWSKREIYEKLVEKTLEPLSGSLAKQSIFKLFYRSFTIHKKSWGELLPKKYRMDGRKMVEAFSGWLYNTVDGIRGESLIRNKMNGVLRGTGFEAVLAPTSREMDDVDILVLRGSEEVFSVSVKTGVRETVTETIESKRDCGKLPSFYCGYFGRTAKERRFWGSVKGVRFIGLEKFLTRVCDNG